MKSKIIVLSVLIALISGIGFAYAESKTSTKLSPKVQQLIDFSEKNEASEAANLLAQLSTKEKDELAKYIEFNSEKVPPVYFIIMADYIYKSNKDKAALWYYIGKFRSYQDTLMCKDKTTQSQLEVYPMLAPKTLKYVATKVNDKKYIANLMQKALDWDIAHPNRVNPVWACYHGISAFVSKPELLPQKEYTNIQNKVRNEIKESINKYKQ
ncbi:MAG: hypothetical protein VZR09_08810 [Candidatus Gastranaerophilaceae bacterium]|jgi:hypothetical protein|nr:hypothetical protein [Candidatus Gastranaerophilaceae bacterium]